MRMNEQMRTSPNVETRALKFGEGKKPLGQMECVWGEEGIEKKRDQLVHPELEARYRVLHSLKLTGPKGMVDVLALAKAMGLEVRVAEGRNQVRYYQTDGNKGSEIPHVVVPPLDTPIDIAVLLHELGHGQQGGDATFGALKTLHHFDKDFKAGADKERVFQGIEDLSLLFPEKADDLRRARQELQACTEEVEACDRQMIELDADIQEIEKKKDIAFQAFIKEAIQRRLLELGKNSARDVESVDDLEKIGFTFGPNEEQALEFTIGGDSLTRDRGPFPRNQAEGYPPAVLRMLERASYDKIAWDFAATDDHQLALRLQATDGYLDVRLPGSFAALDDLIQDIKKIDAESTVKAKERTAVRTRRDKAAAQWTHIMQGGGVADVLMYPRRAIERDATVRAKRWLRKLQEKTGVDLTRAVHQQLVENILEEDEQVGENPCVTSVAQDIDQEPREGISATQRLNQALRSYRASGSEMLQRGQSTSKPKKLIKGEK